MSGIESMFAGMDQADLNGKGTYMGEGVFDVLLKAIKFKPNGFKGKSFIVEFQIVTSTNPAHAPGTSGSWVLKWDRPQAKGDAKALMLACLGHDPKTVGAPAQQPELHRLAAQLAMAACDDEYAAHAGMTEHVAALEDMPLRLECVKVKTQKGGDFTVHNWSPAPEGP